jgi:DNA recombination protein RmuC
METVLLFIVVGLLIIGLIVVLVKRPDNYKEDFINLKNQLSANDKAIEKIESSVKEEVRQNRQELLEQLKSNRTELSTSLAEFRKELMQTLTTISTQNKDALKDFQDAFDKNVKSFNDLQREKFGLMETKQDELIQNTEKKLEKMRETVDEKLQKTLNERLGQSFELVSKQLKDVELGLGEMKTLAQDVGGLKKVLSNVKMRGGIGEVQLEMLLEQVLAPDQYEANVKTKQGSADLVEFAIKLPGRDIENTTVYLPIDAKFPKDVYEQLVDAYDSGDPSLIDTASKNIESVIKKMAKDIREKYLDPPNTTDFGIMFLPFEGIYAEVVRRAALLEQLQREFKVVVTGPTTLAAILNSLQMGFRTLAIQQRSSEVWKVLGAVKKEFENFSGMLEKAHKEITKAGDTIEELRGKRTRAISRKLKEVEALPAKESREVLPEIASGEVIDEEEGSEI